MPFCFLNSLLALCCALGITTLQKELGVKISNPKTSRASLNRRSNTQGESRQTYPVLHQQSFSSMLTLGCAALGDGCPSGRHLSNHSQRAAMSPPQGCPHLITGSVICWEHPTGTPANMPECWGRGLESAGKQVTASWCANTQCCWRLVGPQLLLFLSQSSFSLKSWLNQVIGSSLTIEHT